MLFTTKWMSTIFSGTHHLPEKEIQINEITTDSRGLCDKALFIPLIGDNFDGHHYVLDAVENGAIATLWDQTIPLPENFPATIPVFYVDDTLIAMQQLAKEYRTKINPTVIAITGSNGKTTTKDIAASVMKTTFKTHFTKGNLNNEIGVPLTILSMPRDTEVLILEMGMNHFGEIERLSMMGIPDYAIITNIGESHIEHLGSRKGIAKAKQEIISGLKDDGCLIIDGDEQLLNHLHQHQWVVTCGFGHHNAMMIDMVAIGHHTTAFRINHKHTYDIPLLGAHHAKNTSFIITLAMRMGVEQNAIKQGLTELTHTSMRFELLKGKNGVSLINDTYNASPTSMKAAINVVKQMDGFNQKILVLGDILELGEFAGVLHRTVADVIDDTLTAVYTYGDDAKEITDQVKKTSNTIQCKHYKSTDQLIQDLQRNLQADVLILFKASRGMQFEKLVEQLM